MINEEIEGGICHLDWCHDVIRAFILRLTPLVGMQGLWNFISSLWLQCPYHWWGWCVSNMGSQFVTYRTDFETNNFVANMECLQPSMWQQDHQQDCHDTISTVIWFVSNPYAQNKMLIYQHLQINHWQIEVPYIHYHFWNIKRLVGHN